VKFCSYFLLSFFPNPGVDSDPQQSKGLNFSTIQNSQKMVCLLLSHIRRIPTVSLELLEVTTMKHSMNNAIGIQRIVNRYKTHFRVPENLNFYSREDLVAAERKFLKYAIINGGFESTQREKSLGNQVSRRHSA